MSKPNFRGWATRYNVRCTDGRTIKHSAFADCDGKEVPLVWNHQHNNPKNVIGKGILHNCAEGVRVDGYLNDSDYGVTTKIALEHGDVTALSIFANHLTQDGPYVCHGEIKEVSICIGGANPEAFIDEVLTHGEEEGAGAIIYFSDEPELLHGDEEGEEPAAEQEPEAKEEPKEPEAEKPLEHSDEKEKTVGDILNELTEEQREVVMGLIGTALESTEKDTVEHSETIEEGDDTMKKNIFETQQEGAVLSHDDCKTIVAMAQDSKYGTLQHAIEAFIEDNESLAHADLGIDQIETLFPEYKDVRGGAPEMITSDQGWIGKVMAKVHKSPISRIRTRQADVKSTREGLRARGYKKGAQKTERGNIKLLTRTTDPQTVYVKSKLNRDDIIDITDFDVVAYMYSIDRMNLNEELATAIMISDGRDDGDEDKIREEHIRPIYQDDELYTIHADVDIAAMKAELQGSDTSKHFGENYIYAEAVVQSLLYARENYKGSGTPDFYCTPHLVNVMLLARDLNGRRIYENVNELKAALNVGEIITCEQFEGVTREVVGDEGKVTKNLLGILVNLSDYSLGATKGGEITHFTDFDIDFNQEKSLLETRCSGALTRVKSAIALEIPAA